MDITLKQTESKGFAIAKDGDQKAGEMSYSIASDKHIIIDHTAVETEYRGKDVGKKLLLKVVEMARENDIKITPLCPFAAAMYKKLPTIQDTLKQN